MNTKGTKTPKEILLLIPLFLAPYGVHVVATQQSTDPYYGVIEGPQAVLAGGMMVAVAGYGLYLYFTSLTEVLRSLWVWLLRLLLIALVCSVLPHVSLWMGVGKVISAIVFVSSPVVLLAFAHRFHREAVKALEDRRQQ